jgi:hypothetical protein
MSRSRQENSEPINGDSFLDIVASVVSIMIVMVVLVGLHVKNGPVTVSIPNSPAREALAKDEAAVVSMQKDVAKMTGELEHTKFVTAGRSAQRDAILRLSLEAEQKLEERKKQLSAANRGDYELMRGTSEAKYRLDQLNRQRAVVENAPAAPVVLASYQTPLSRAVDGPEAHVLISNGRVVFVPVEALTNEVRMRIKTQNENEITEMLGPIDGFRIRYTAIKQNSDDNPRIPPGATYTSVTEFTIVPDSNELGESVRVALMPDSQFNKKLATILRGRTAITIWIYPDGFDAFRQIRNELYLRGYPVAARPLPFGESIGGSPQGSKSAAQ